MTGACDACGCALHECECPQSVQYDPIALYEPVPYVPFAYTIATQPTAPKEEKPDPYPFINEETTPWVDGSGLTPGPLPRHR